MDKISSGRISLCKDGDPRFPIQAFFNAISDQNFLHIVSNLVQRIGCGIDVAICLFPGDLDPGDKVFDGVRFSLFEDEIVVDEQSFLQYLTMACDAYLISHPTDKSKIDDLLKSF